MSAYSHVVITFLCLCLTLLFLLVLIFSFHHLQGGIQGELSYVSWNRKVQNILASTSFSGTSGEMVVLSRANLLCFSALKVED
jgi:hypothetical protein